MRRLRRSQDQHYRESRVGGHRSAPSGAMPVRSDLSIGHGPSWRDNLAHGTVRAVKTVEQDSELIARIRDGDEDAMASLYDRYAGPLVALAYRILGDRAEAEDVALSALARAWREAHRFESARGSVRAWLTVMTRSRAMDAARRARTREATAGRDLTAGRATSEDPAGAAERDEDRRLVLAALAELPDTQREAIELAYYGGLSQTEIAARLGAPLGTVKTRIRDGMKKLRTALRPLYVEPGP